MNGLVGGPEAGPLGPLNSVLVAKSNAHIHFVNNPFREHCLIRLLLQAFRTYTYLRRINRQRNASASRIQDNSDILRHPVSLL